MNQFEEFEKILGMVPLDEDKKKAILEHSMVFFEYRDYMKKKHDISDEEVEAMSNEYVQAKLSENPDKMELVRSGNMLPISEFAQQQATAEGFDKPIQESMMVFMNFYKGLSGGEF